MGRLTPLSIARLCAHGREPEAAMREDRIDEAVLALLYLGHWLEGHDNIARAWKSLDWSAMADRQEQIYHPV
jgi:hypothetical protein